MATFEKWLDDIAELPQDERGGAFEALAREFLEAEAIAMGATAEVERWEPWAARQPKTVNRRDTGADLVVTVRAEGFEELWAVQCKFHTDRSASDGAGTIAKLIAVSAMTEFDRLVLVTSGAGISSNAAFLAKSSLPVDTYTSADIIEANRLESAKSVSAFFEARDYQERAISDILESLRAHDAVQYVSACGTGKTFVSTELSRRVGSQFSLFAAPRLYLLKQTVRLYRQQFRGLKVLIVCSDIGVSAEEDGRFASDLGAEQSARCRTPEELVERAAIARAEGRQVLVCTTYQSAHVVEKAHALGLPPFNFGFIDEAHYLVTGYAGIPLGTSVERLCIEKTVFATATPRINEADSDVLKPRYGMMDRDRFGPLAHSYGFRQAIAEQNLSEYELCLSFYADAAGEEKYERRASIALTEIREAFFAGKRRFISYHTSRREAQEFAEAVEREVGIPACFMTSEDTNAAARASIIKKFDAPETDKQGFLVANVRILMEGVDIPSLDAVVFVRPIKSSVMIAQAVGRVLRINEGSPTVGAIILPTLVPASFIESAPNVGELERLRDARIEDESALSVLLAIAQHDDMITEVVRKRDKVVSDGGGIIVDFPIGIQARLLEAVSNRVYDLRAMGWDAAVGKARAEALKRIRARAATLPGVPLPRDARKWEAEKEKLTPENSKVVIEVFDDLQVPIPDDIKKYLTAYTEA